MFITACNKCANSPPKQSVCDIRLHTKSPATKNYMELWWAAAPSASPGSATDHKDEGSAW